MGRVTASRQPHPAAASRAIAVFDAIRDGIWGLLPVPLNRWIPATAVGYVLINSCTFSLDIAMMSLLFDLAHLPYPVAVSIGYACALSLGYVLNRVLNFESHAKVGGEAVRYVVVAVANYLVLVVGLSWLLHSALNVQAQLARIMAACAEAVAMYCCLRWWVFPRRAGQD